MRKTAKCKFCGKKIFHQVDPFWPGRVWWHADTKFYYCGALLDPVDTSHHATPED